MKKSITCTNPCPKERMTFFADLRRRTESTAWTSLQKAFRVLIQRYESIAETPTENRLLIEILYRSNSSADVLNTKKSLSASS